MKKIIISAIVILIAINASGKDVNEKTSKMEETFTYEVYGDIPVDKTTFEETHFLGDVISPKWNTFQHNYTRTYDVSVGLSNEGVEIRKPAIYKAVERANKWVKHALKKKEIERDYAVSVMSHILDCANVLVYENNTTKLEHAVNDAKTGKDVAMFFDHVILNKY